MSLALPLLASAALLQGPIPDTDVRAGDDGVIDLPAESHPVLVDLFERYTRLVAPNGGAIHLVATAGVPDEELVRAREVMRFYLTDAPGTRFGSDKAGVANSMADHGACLVMFARERDAFRAYEQLERVDGLFFQDLYASETVVEGDQDFQTNAVRDATLEEVFHLVQGSGIRFALPAYHRQLEQAAVAAVRADRWRTSPEWWLEGSSSYEYIISVIDVMYGLWEHDPQGNGESFGAEYVHCTRAAIEEHDAPGVAALRAFLPDHFAAELRIHPGFEGRFSLQRDPQHEYTLKSQWLTSVRLTGTQDTALLGNARDNLLGGNAGDNHIDGGAGCDTVAYPGPRARYTLERRGDVMLVSGDGVDELVNVERLLFADGEEQYVDSDCSPLTRTPLEVAVPGRNGEWQEWDEDRPREAALELLANFDTNDDGLVTREEIPRSMRAFRDVVEESDRDGDKAASVEEIERFVERIFDDWERDDPEREARAE